MAAPSKTFRLGVVIGAGGMLIVCVVALLATARVSNNPAKPAKTSATIVAAPVNPIQPFDWRTVESEDYRKYIARLRAIGCPEETIRDIIVADVNKLFEDRRVNLLPVKTNRFEFWKVGRQRFTVTQPFDEERFKAQQGLAKEKRTVIKELLGIELEEKLDFMPVSPFEEMLDFLTPSKRMEIMELEQKFTAKGMERAVAGVGMNAMKELEKAREAEVGGLLSPTELEEYQLRRSRTANTMARELEGFDPSEQEFREIFKLRRQIEDEFGWTPRGTLGSAATEKLNDQIKSVLGEFRYADYERSQDPVYQAIYRVTESNGLGKDAANRVFDLKKVAENQAAVVRTDAALGKEQRDLALLGIRRETESAVRTVLGNEAFHVMQGQTGYWLQNISPNSLPVSQ